MMIFWTPGHPQNVEISDSTLFDFWVGDWTLSWTSSDGKRETGSNRIEKILDGKVIQEHFSDDKKSLEGTSISVYDSQKGSWHQAWADNQGGYFDFQGSVMDGKRMFGTAMKEVDGKKVMQRMVFYDISHDAFMWDWELTKDGGKTWALQWRIHYKRNL